MHVSILDDMYRSGGTGLLCSGTNTAANYETFLSLRYRKEQAPNPGDVCIEGERT
jgi:hypothetical protein